MRFFTIRKSPEISVRELEKRVENLPSNFSNDHKALKIEYNYLMKQAKRHMGYTSVRSFELPSPSQINEIKENLISQYAFAFCENTAD